MLKSHFYTQKVCIYKTCNIHTSHYVTEQEEKTQEAYICIPFETIERNMLRGYGSLKGVTVCFAWFDTLRHSQHISLVSGRVFLC